jgi:hypothetical protein
LRSHGSIDVGAPTAGVVAQSDATASSAATEMAAAATFLAIF